MKSWHRSMKRKPRVGEDILIIWKDKNITSVTIDTMLLDEYGKSYLCCSHDSYDWDFVAPMIKQWAYVDKYFEKEINNDKDTN